MKYNYTFNVITCVIYIALVIFGRWVGWGWGVWGRFMLIHSRNRRTRRPQGIHGGDRNFNCPSKVVSWLKHHCRWILNNRIAFITDPLYGPISMVLVLSAISYTWFSTFLCLYITSERRGYFFSRNCVYCNRVLIAYTAISVVRYDKITVLKHTSDALLLNITCKWFYQYGTGTITWVNNYIQYSPWDEIINPCHIFKGS